ncbi:MAG: carbonic anhydrase [Microcoleus sp. PH2017_10_PVI_O_A]|uniref:carbonic anhydrase n=1 Tax=unclassified Microcoleus TaxID=2642155 RepID=UPI001D90A71D|nr:MULTISPECIES: carbonic anhydrase [unclassified Microcoleus]TAE85282.1 MAG: carbonic anhydrase [Oscillatoriales cyanobacterium]MCC3406885.1 carbonic anhydrase [Microcoleus sp. PH2017_10_PVI_O_A]MCC3458757.1 carbonic anhydrase [Microcoleus sp. PH2017_11_PCY_U_A]MCC3476959.1 carbonic anhydrase [Microcoleus sp. PH2017_12_PCY_D_A]MCC3530907.1 carbonic anhydrase [Microcoleus sp. PH2017_21_RUC_O_A]
MTESERMGMISRRNLMLMAGAGTLAASIAPTLLQAQAANAETISDITPDGALKKLMEGNQRYIDQKRTFPDQARSRIVEVAKGQHPFATVLACSDSRVTPEIIFDQGLGDLFDVRIAGNFLDDVVLGNIEYAALELGVPLLVILGHERCGAVKAALDGKAVPGHISTLVEAIKPAVDATKNLAGDAWDNAVRANVKMNVEKLKDSSPILAEAVKAGKLKVVGGRYDLDSGKVEIIA